MKKVGNEIISFHGIKKEKKNKEIYSEVNIFACKIFTSLHQKKSYRRLSYE